MWILKIFGVVAISAVAAIATTRIMNKNLLKKFLEIESMNREELYGILKMHLDNDEKDMQELKKILRDIKGLPDADFVEKST